MKNEKEKKQDIEEVVKKEVKQEVKHEIKEHKPKKKKSFIRRHWAHILVGILVLVFAFVIIHMINEYRKQTVVGISSSEVVGSNYKTVADTLTSQGFKNIKTIELNDLSLDELDQEGNVQKITIDDDDSFSKDDKFKNDDTVCIIYHSAKIVKTPLSAKKMEGKNYKDVVKQLQDAGFESIKTVKDADLVLGILSKENTVSQVSINGDTKFDKDESYRIDAEVTVTYHVYK